MDAAAARVWTDDDTFACCLLALGLDRYGPGPGEDPSHSPINWTPQTWRDEIKDDCGVEITPRNLDRLMAACVILQSPHEFYATTSGFSDIVSGLASVWFDPTVWHPPTVEETLWGVIEAHLISPPDGDGDERFSPEIVRYVNALARNEGFRNLPHAFQIFGIETDPSVWASGPDFEYSSEPDTMLAIEQAANDRESDLDADTADRLRALADKMSALPVRGNPGPIVAELRQYADKISSAGDAVGGDDE